MAVGAGSTIRTSARPTVASGHLMAEWSHQLGLLPLLGVLALRPQSRSCWWVAAAFAVSYFADYGTHLGIPPYVTSRAYPILQTLCIGLAFGTAWEVEGMALLLFFVAFVTTLLWPSDTMALRTICWLGICALAGEYAERSLRTALLVTFGGGLVGWMAYDIFPSTAAWLGYRGAWLLGELLFVRACWRHRKGLVYG